MDFLQKNKKSVLVATGLGLLGLGVYAYLKSSAIEANAEGLAPGSEANGKFNHSHVFQKEKRYQEMVERLKKALKGQKGRASKQTIIAVNQAILELFKKDYLETFQRIRKNRRQYLNDLQKYAEEYANGTLETEKLLENATVEALRDLELDPATFEAECEQIAESDPNFSMFMLYMLETLKVQIPTTMTRKLTTADIVQAFEYQNELLDTIDFSGIGNMDFEYQLLCKQAYISDMSSMKLKFEEEDIARNPALLNAEPKITQLHAALQEKLHQGY